MKPKVDVINVNQRGARKRPSQSSRKEQERRRAEMRRRKKRQRRRELLLRMGTLTAVLVLGALAVSAFSNKNDSEEIVSYEWMTGKITGIVKTAEDVEILQEPETVEVYQPIGELRKISDAEMDGSLLALVGKYPEFQDIYDNMAKYPVDMIKALCNNPEMFDFVSGYLDADGSVSGKITSEEMKKEYPLLLQWDARWGYVPYGGNVIGLAGCGPTCLSMIIAGLTGEGDITPADVAAYSMANEYYIEGTGTAWSLMTEGIRNYGIQAVELGLDEDLMKYNLDHGRPIICSLRPGDFTTEGHFIVVYDYDENGFFINDPNSTIRSAKQWTFEELSWQIKIMWAYSEM